MARRPPQKETQSASGTRQQWSDTLARVYRRETRVLVEKSGIPVAAIVSVDDLEQLERLDERQDAFEALDRTRSAFEGVPDQELDDRVAAALAQVRGEPDTSL